MLTIVTGASENHSKSLRNFLHSIGKFADMMFRCVVFDLGFTATTKASIQKEFPTFEHRLFDFSKHPEYFDIRVNAGEYAWKPAILYEISLETQSTLLWCDAGNLICAPLSCLHETIQSDGIFSTITSGDVRLWTHPLTRTYFGIADDDIILSQPNRNGAIIGVDCARIECREFLKTLDELAHTKQCIAPQGSNRSNHRQDQAVMTILFYRFRDQYTCRTRNDRTRLISTHNDCD